MYLATKIGSEGVYLENRIQHDWYISHARAIRTAAVTELREQLLAINVNLRPGEGTPGATTAWGIMVLPHGLPKIGGSPAAPGNRADACGAMTPSQRWPVMSYLAYIIESV